MPNKQLAEALLRMTEKKDGGDQVCIVIDVAAAAYYAGNIF